MKKLSLLMLTMMLSVFKSMGERLPARRQSTRPDTLAPTIRTAAALRCRALVAAEAGCARRAFLCSAAIMSRTSFSDISV